MTDENINVDLALIENQIRASNKQQMDAIRRTAQMGILILKALGATLYCCETCSALRALPEPIKNKIQILMRLGK